MEEGAAVAYIVLNNISQMFSTLHLKNKEFIEIQIVLLLTRAEILGPELSIPLLVSVGRA